MRSTHGAWSVICDTPAGASEEQCALMQNVIADDRPEVGLSVVVLKTADRKSRILRVLAPLGVLLPNGLGLNVDGKDIGRAYFVRCFSDGCYAEVVLQDDLLKTLRAVRRRPSSCSSPRKKASAFRSTSRVLPTATMPCPDKPKIGNRFAATYLICADIPSFR